eukprot:6186968-Pleurochrysis_carterae.AAC.8
MSSIGALLQTKWRRSGAPSPAPMRRARGRSRGPAHGAPVTEGVCYCGGGVRRLSRPADAGE